MTICTICAGIPSPGFYTGCMFKDGVDTSPWACDGKGNLTLRQPSEAMERSTTTPEKETNQHNG